MSARAGQRLEPERLLLVVRHLAEGAVGRGLDIADLGRESGLVFVEYTWKRALSRDRGWRLCTSRLARGAGASARGIAVLYLFTPDQADYYAKLGWEAIAVEPCHGQAVTVMTARLRKSM